MNSFKFWILSLCGATAISSIFKILLSNSSVKKVVNIFLSLFVLLYTIMPIQSIINDFSFDDDLSGKQTDFNNYYVDGYEQIVKISIENECEKMSVKVVSFNIESYIDNDGNLVVERLEIDIDNDEKSIDIATQIKNSLGFEVNVT